jgi:hypothetical protein
LKCFVRLWRTFFKPDSGFWMAFTFQGQSSVSRRWQMFRATKHQQNDRKCSKNLRTHPQRLSPNNLWAHRHRWNQLWSLPGDCNRKFEDALHFHEVCPPTLDKWSKAAAHKHVSWAMREG